MMTETEYIIRILQDFLRGEKTKIEDVNWERLRAIAHQQELSAIVYRQTRNPLFEKAYLYQVSRALRIENQLRQLAGILEDYEYFLMKGSCLKECYPLPELRSMGDVDMVVHREDRQQIHRCLVEHGFSFQESWEEQWIYKKGDIIYEIHDRLVVSREGNPSHEEFAARVWDYVQNKELDWNYHFVYILTHLRKHLVGHGVGLRQFMDVAVLCRYKPELDWDWISRELDRMGMLAFAQRVFAFNERTFGVRAPIGVEAMEEDFYQETLDRIFKDGVFGHDNPDPNHDEVAKLMRQQGLNTGAARRRVFLKMAFPPYDQLRKCGYLAYLNGHKFLLPLAWLHRAVYRLCDRQHRQSLMEIVGVKEDTLQKQEERLAKWGL